MNNEQHPNPWSREATPGQPSWPASSASQPTTPQPSVAPQADVSGATQPTTTGAASQTPFTNWNSPASAFGQPSSQQSQAGVTTAPQAPKAKGRSRVAGVLAVALLAAGIGGGAGYAGAQFAGGGSASSATTTSTTTSNGTSTTVVQADPSNPNWTTVADAVSKSVVAINVTTSSGEAQGSGVIIDAQGHIVTNNHVVSGATNGAVTVLIGNVSYAATIVGTDPSTDLAVIKLTDPPKDLSVMTFGDSTSLKVGDPVMAIGNPLGLADTVTTGIVSALNRPVTTTATTSESQTQQQEQPFGGRSQTAQTTSETVVTAAIQTNAAINPGNSGGALVNGSGELVGITSSIATLSSGQESSSSGNIGIGFAIGADQVKYVADQLIASGTAQHPQIGITAGDVTSTGQQGAVVGDVTSGSPAEKAGLKSGDLITAVDGQPVSSSESLVALVRAGQVGQEMTLTVVRNGSEESITVTPVAAGA